MLLKTPFDFVFQEADEDALLMLDTPLTFRYVAHLLVSGEKPRDAWRVSHRSDVSKCRPRHFAHLNRSVESSARFVWPVNRIDSVVDPCVRKSLCVGRFVQIDAMHGATLTHTFRGHVNGILAYLPDKSRAALYRDVVRLLCYILRNDTLAVHDIRRP
jgi:hypothetical protein